MKKILLFMLALVPLAASANHFEVDGLYYEKTGASEVAVVMGDQEYSGDVVVPVIITCDGVEYIVSSIAHRAFSGCKNLTSIKISNSIATIESEAFYGCSGLTSVMIGTGLKNIGWDAFSNCFGLAMVDITDLEAWCGIVFKNRDSNPLCYAHHLLLKGEELKTLEIPNTVSVIRAYVFEGCQSLESVKLANMVTVLDDCVFRDCIHLASINLPEAVTNIGPYAFSGCSSLTEIAIPSRLTTISYNTFEGCSNLTTVTLGSSVKDIEMLAFKNCSSLSSIKIPDGLKSIGESAFYDCKSLKSLTIPESVNSIGNSAFSLCKIDSLTLFCRLGDYTSALLGLNEGSVIYAYYTEIPSIQEAFRGKIVPFDVDGIKKKKSAISSPSAVYSIQGSKVTKSQGDRLPKGVYIQNGRKFVVK